MAPGNLRGSRRDCAGCGGIFERDLVECLGLRDSACSFFVNDRTVLGDGVGKLGRGDGGPGNCVDECHWEPGKWIRALSDWIFARFDGQLSRWFDERCGTAVTCRSDRYRSRSKEAELRIRKLKSHEYGVGERESLRKEGRE